jgi:hypothetical protein
MSGRRPRDEERVLALVRRAPGLTQRALRWADLGGELADGRPVGEVWVTPAALERANGISKRLTDLVHRGRVVRRPLAPGAVEHGYWSREPAVPAALREGVRTPRPQAAETPGDQASGTAALRGLRGLLGGRDG